MPYFRFPEYLELKKWTKFSNREPDIITKDRPRKLYRGKKRLAMWMYNPHLKRFMTWALSVKVGDYIFNGTANSRVEDFYFIWANEGAWRRCKKSRNWFLEDVIFKTNNGWAAANSLFECGPAKSVDEIRSLYKNLFNVDVELDEFGQMKNFLDIPKEDLFEKQYQLLNYDW